MADSAKTEAMPAMSPAAIRQQLQKRLHALEETKTLYSERAKMFLGDRANKSETVDEDVSIKPPAPTSSAQAIRQQIFNRLQQLEENKAKYTERAKQFLDRERKEASSREPSKEAQVTPPASPAQPTPDLTYADKIQSQLDARVSQDTQDMIRAGVVQTQLDTQETQGAIQDELHQTREQPVPVSPYAAPNPSEGSPQHRGAQSPALAVSRALAGEPSLQPNSPSKQLNDTFERVVQWANGTPLKYPGQFAQPFPDTTSHHSPLRFERTDTNTNGVVRQNEFGNSMQDQSSHSQPNVLVETVVQSLHDSIGSMASESFTDNAPSTPDCDGLLRMLFDRILISSAGWSELRLLTSNAHDAQQLVIPQSQDHLEFQQLVYCILDSCFNEFAARVGQGEYYFTGHIG